MAPHSLSSRRRFLGQSAAAVAAALGLPGAALAQAEWPTKPIKVVCNFPAGSSPDALMRAISQPLQQALGQPVVIDNRAGASGIIGADIVAKSPADGYTLLMTAGSTITTNPHVFAKMPFDAAKDLVPVAALARLNLFLVTRGDFPAKDVQSFLAYLKANPGKVSYGSAGNATRLHPGGERRKRQAGVEAGDLPSRRAPRAPQDPPGGGLPL